MSVIESFENLDMFKGIFKYNDGKKNRIMILTARIVLMVLISVSSIFLDDISYILSFAGSNLSAFLNYIFPVIYY